MPGMSETSTHSSTPPGSTTPPLLPKKRGKTINGLNWEHYIADVQGSNKYLGIPQANGDHEEATRKSAKSKTPTEGSAGPERNKIEPSTPAPYRSTTYLGKGGDRCHWYQCTEDFTKKSNTLRLYTKKREGGLELVSIRATIHNEIN